MPKLRTIKSCSRCCAEHCRNFNGPNASRTCSYHDESSQIPRRILGRHNRRVLVAADVLSTKAFFLPPAGGWNPGKVPDLPMYLPPGDGDYWATMSMKGKVADRIVCGDLISIGGEVFRIDSVESIHGFDDGWRTVTARRDGSYPSVKEYGA